MTEILVIDDETPLRQEIMDWLAFEGYEVRGAADGVEGVNCAILHPPDLIVCDISMPRLDGYGVLLEIQANSTIQSTPFIFLSAKASHDDIRRGMQLGADDYVTKPFNRLELLQAIRLRLDKEAKHDLEHQKQIEAFKEALEIEHQQHLLRAKLVAMFSHDFRNQLTVILSSVSLVRDFGNRITEQRRLERLNNIEGSARLLLGMLDDMLDLAQMETGNLALKPEPLGVAQFLQDIVEEFRAIHGVAHPIVFEYHHTDIERVDPRLLRQIASNVISNAIKYSPVGSTVRVTLDKHEQYWRMTIQDQGFGIPEDDQRKLFEAFHRASNVGKIQGTGLGLAVVKQAVDLMGGSIQVESQVGTGTTMTVTIPR